MEPTPVLALLLALSLGAAAALAARLRTTRAALRASESGRRSLARADVADRARIDALEGELRLLADGLDAGLLRVDAAGTVIDANPAAHAILGRAPGTIVRRPLLDAVVDPRIERRAAAPLATLPLDEELERTGGGALALRVLAAPDGGRWLLLRDASELARLRRIRTEFVDNLSHELRTPVTTIGILAESLALEADADGSGASERMRERIGKIELETGHLAQMVGELLDLARVESGRGIEPTEEVDLAAVAAAAVERMRPFAERSRVDLAPVAADAGPLPPVLGDRARLEQVLVNLLHNAVKFSAPGGRVEVSVEAGAEMVRVAVRDEGIGIDPADQARLFERFYKADRARVPGRGTGLGLAIARHVVEGHGGRITVASAPGRGSTFTVEIPTIRAA